MSRPYWIRIYHTDSRRLLRESVWHGPADALDALGAFKDFVARLTVYYEESAVDVELWATKMGKSYLAFSTQELQRIRAEQTFGAELAALLFG